jgi:hypothetical protein
MHETPISPNTGALQLQVYCNRKCKCKCIYINDCKYGHNSMQCTSGVRSSHPVFIPVYTSMYSAVHANPDPDHNTARTCTPTVLYIHMYTVHTPRLQANAIALIASRGMAISTLYTGCLAYAERSSPAHLSLITSNPPGQVIR